MTYVPNFRLTTLGAGWNWGPLALFLRPLFFGRVESSVSEYASMTVLPGGLLLVGAVLSLRWLRSPTARWVQSLGGLPVVFYTVLGSGRNDVEFWWANLAVVPFAVLTAGVLARARRPGWATACVVGLTLTGVLDLVGSADNCCPSRLMAPPAAALARCQSSERSAVVRHREHDHSELSRVAGWRLPVAAYYVKQLDTYAHRLAAAQASGRDLESDGWAAVPLGRLTEERQWAQRVCRSLSGTAPP